LSSKTVITIMSNDLMRESRNSWRELAEALAETATARARGVTSGPVMARLRQAEERLCLLGETPPSAPADVERDVPAAPESAPSLERSVGIRYAEVTPDERRAVDRIKSGYWHMSRRERLGSPSDIVMDLSVAIAAELRRERQAGAVQERALVVADLSDLRPGPSEPPLTWVAERIDRGAHLPQAGDKTS
jgi:hypothetical protein